MIGNQVCITVLLSDGISQSTYTGLLESLDQAGAVIRLNNDGATLFIPLHRIFEITDEGNIFGKAQPK